MQLTILIPTIGRRQKLERCVNAWVRAITHAKAETSVQVLIADNQSTDGTQSFFPLLFSEATTMAINTPHPLYRVYMLLIQLLSAQLENELKPLYQSNADRPSKLRHFIDALQGVYDAIGELGQPKYFASVIRYLVNIDRHVHHLRRYNRVARFYLPFFYSPHRSISYYTSRWLQHSHLEHELEYHRVLPSYQSHL